MKKFGLTCIARSHLPKKWLSAKSNDRLSSSRNSNRDVLGAKKSDFKLSKSHLWAPSFKFLNSPRSARPKRKKSKSEEIELVQLRVTWTHREKFNSSKEYRCTHRSWSKLKNNTSKPKAPWTNSAISWSHSPQSVTFSTRLIRPLRILTTIKLKL